MLTQQLLKLCVALSDDGNPNGGRSSLGGHANFVDRIARGAQSSYRQQRGQAWGVSEPYLPPPPPQTPMQSPPRTPPKRGHHSSRPQLSGRSSARGGAQFSSRPISAGSGSASVSPGDVGFGDPWAEDPFSFFLGEVQRARQPTTPICPRGGPTSRPPTAAPE